MLWYQVAVIASLQQTPPPPPHPPPPPAEMAAVHRPQILGEESRLCGCEFRQFPSSAGRLINRSWERWPTRLSCVCARAFAGPAHRLRRRRRQVPQRHRHPRLHLQRLHGRQVPYVFCVQMSSYRGVAEWDAFSNIAHHFRAVSVSFLVAGASTTRMGTFWLVRGGRLEVWGGADVFRCHLSQEGW